MSKKDGETVDIIGYYEAKVSVSILCVRLEFCEDGVVHELVMYPEESRKLRKALKRAEKAQRLQAAA